MRKYGLTLALVALMGCATVEHVKTAGLEKCTVHSFGAVTTKCGNVTTQSQGISDGLVGMVGGAVLAARDAFLGFFNRGPAQVVVVPQQEQ